MNPDLLSILAGEIAKLLQPIRDVIENPRLLQPGQLINLNVNIS